MSRWSALPRADGRRAGEAPAVGYASEVFDSLLDVLGSEWWTYPLLVLLTGIDVVFPPLPSETAAITAGILSSQGRLWLPLACACCALGSFAGDNLGYWIGRRGEGFARRWFLRGDKGQRRLDWARRTLTRYGGSIVIVGRFIPGGRSATAIGCGVVGYRYGTYVVYDAVGAATWGAVVTLIGYAGGSTFRDQPWLAFLLSFGAALAVAGLAELGQRLHGRSRRRRTG